MLESQVDTISQFESADPAPIENFHALLFKKGIRLPFAESNAEGNFEDRDNGDAEVAQDENESLFNDEMPEVESPYPEYQKSIRDALADFSEVCPQWPDAEMEYFFTKFMYLETADMEMEVKIKDTYTTILNTLVEYLQDAAAKISEKIDQDTGDFLRSWEASRAAGLKTQKSMENGAGSREKGTKMGGFQKLMKTWGRVE